ncbi:MAG: hypothetical protein HQ578_01895 [Chloroflexi bacterium]|nr:hypothetical protein [Chloroflexota bacterium]
MEELRDYSGDFEPHLKMEDFSKDALVRMWLAAGRMYLGLEGTWSTVVKEKFGEQVARELDAEVWRRQTPIEVRQCRKAMNIWGEDVASLFKHMQVDPGAAGIWPDFECQLENRNHGILTVRRCAPLERCERYGDTVLQKHMCEVLDVEGFEDTAHLFNPKIKVTPLKLPPRQDPDEIACQWEFKVKVEE